MADITRSVDSYEKYLTQGKVKGCAFSFLTLCPDLAAVFLDNPLHGS
jgi:hypothetical protein